MAKSRWLGPGTKAVSQCPQPQAAARRCAIQRENGPRVRIPTAELFRRAHHRAHPRPAAPNPDEDRRAPKVHEWLPDGKELRYEAQVKAASSRASVLPP